jgi:hypothetical protein
MSGSTIATSMRCSAPRPSRTSASRRRLLALAALAAAALAAPLRAETAEEVPPPPALPQFGLDVAEIRIVSAYAPPPNAGAESSVPFAPKAALETWAKTHVRAVGRRWQAWIVIRNASITAAAVQPRMTSWRDWFRRHPVERYDAALELELQIRDDAGRVQAQTIARATHARFLMDDYYDYHRERVAQLQRLTDEIIAAALKRLEAELRLNLARWVR